MKVTFSQKTTTRRSPSLLFICLLGAASLVILTAAGVSAYFLWPITPNEIDLSATESDDRVSVKVEDGYAVFLPNVPAQVSSDSNTVKIEATATQPVHIGLIIMTDARMDWRNAAALAREVALGGHPVAVARFPLNQPAWGKGAVQSIRNKLSSIRVWVLAGSGDGILQAPIQLEGSAPGQLASIVTWDMAGRVLPPMQGKPLVISVADAAAGTAPRDRRHQLSETLLAALKEGATRGF